MKRRKCKKSVTEIPWEEWLEERIARLEREVERLKRLPVLRPTIWPAELKDECEQKEAE